MLTERFEIPPQKTSRMYMNNTKLLIMFSGFCASLYTVKVIYNVYQLIICSRPGACNYRRLHNMAKCTVRLN